MRLLFRTRQRIRHTATFEERLAKEARRFREAGRTAPPWQHGPRTIFGASPAGRDGIVHQQVADIARTATSSGIGKLVRRSEGVRPLRWASFLAMPELRGLIPDCLTVGNWTQADVFYGVVMGDPKHRGVQTTRTPARRKPLRSFASTAASCQKRPQPWERGGLDRWGRPWRYRAGCSAFRPSTPDRLNLL
jgi:hypothetical protein